MTGRTVVLKRFSKFVKIQQIMFSLSTIALRAFQLIVEFIYLPIHVIRLFKSSKKCPPIRNNILLIPASELAKRIRRKQITSLEVIEAYILRIKEVNPIINAVIENRFDDAVQEAKKVDDFLANSSLNEEEIEGTWPLLGVPITVKGSIAVKGLAHSSGRVDHLQKAPEDAVPVKRARDAGAIPLLTSNVPELCLNWETRNKLVGTTNNPYDDCRTPGGSSGGEASLLGSGASLIGIGSDIAGSLRLPAHFCGIWGHKPSSHAVSTEGHYPSCKNKEKWNEVFIIGPLARYVSDLKLLLQIISEPHIRSDLKLNQKVDVRTLKIFYMKDTGSLLSNSTNSEVIAAIDKVITHFDNICVSKCRKVEIPLMKYCSELSYLHMLPLDVENIFDSRGNGVYKELLLFLSGNSKYEFTSIVYGLLKRNLDRIPVKSMNEISRYINKLHSDFCKLLGDDAVLILPTSPTEATYHWDVFRRLFTFGSCSIFNSLGFPVTNCPITFSKRGLPIGIQVVGAPNLDRLTLCVAEELERTFGGWKFDHE